jgi:uncharacterized membrane protein
VGEEELQDALAERFGQLPKLEREMVRPARAPETVQERRQPDVGGGGHELKLMPVPLMARFLAAFIDSLRPRTHLGADGSPLLSTPEEHRMSSPQPTPAQGTGLSPNLAGALAYLLGPITGIIFLVIEKNDRFVRFHAMQSTVFWVAWFVAGIAFSILSGVVPIIGWIFGLIGGLIMSVVGLVIWLLQMYKAYQGQEWELPVVGQFARKQLGQTV